MQLMFRLATMMFLVQDLDITETNCSVLTIYGEFHVNIFLKWIFIMSFSLAGVTEAMLREAYPGGVPDTAFSGTVDLTSDNEEEDIKTEIKEEEE